ncbi:uncharacterized protein N7506_008922 [Penicillium brevicompactum]|uniref:uncharacterized protein n=1 Tax=Penicillium brevicompactum TaxID=5074 RepID=UPI00254046A1|nr:uncharacterized protein N7506_008922 [Penicillium brevicompactum]KAJ5325820.1 hypothetical protein N7506_008922 [Penicillium brevicompactum]
MSKAKAPRKSGKASERQICRAHATALRSTVETVGRPLFILTETVNTSQNPPATGFCSHHALGAVGMTVRLDSIRNEGKKTP